MKPNFWKPEPDTYDGLRKLFDTVQSGPHRGIVMLGVRWVNDGYKALKTRRDLGGASQSISAAQVAFALGYAAAKMGWDVQPFPRVGLAAVPELVEAPKESAPMTDEEYREWARETHGLSWRGSPSRRRMEDDVAAVVSKAA